MTKCQKLSRKAAWFAGRGASVIALLAATGGISQANAQGAESEKTAGIDELVVTAQKRAQSAQDVGITINSYGAEQIEKFGWEAPEDVAGMTPGLFVSPGASGGAAANYSIRGIGLNDFTTNNSSPVAVHIDEVFLPSMNFLNFGLFDLERVEVLKGPQGTLFGRNTTGGTVNFYTRKPTEEFEAGITAGAARHSRADIDAYVSGPVSDTLSYRLSGFFRTQSGGDGFNSFYNREVGGIDEWWSVRGQLAWRPT